MFCFANAHQIAKIRSHCDINNNFLMYWWNLYYMWVVSFKLLYSSAANISYLSRAVTKIAFSWLLAGGELNKSKILSFLVFFFKSSQGKPGLIPIVAMGNPWALALIENPVLISHLVYFKITMVHVWPRLELRSPSNPKLHTLLITTTKTPCVLQLTILCIFIGYHHSCENVT